MDWLTRIVAVGLVVFAFSDCRLWGETDTNPMIHADVPDISMIRVGDTYYMSSTTMHMSPGLPIMKSTDLVNWRILNYAHDRLADNDALNLEDGRNAYGQGSWASSLRYHNGVYYVSTFSATTGKTHVFHTNDIEREPWQEKSFRPSLHDASLFFDDDDKVYMLWGAGRLQLVELNADLSGMKVGGINTTVIENASEPAGTGIMLQAEGSQLFKQDGKYYLFNITWPRGGMRSVVLHRADQITGPWEGRLALQDQGIAQGGMIDTPDGKWFAYLFQDHGAVGRIPYLVPMSWQDGWPVLGTQGRVPMKLDLPTKHGLIPGIVDSDEFERNEQDRPLPLVWQWNHNPDDAHWSLSQRPGFLRIQTGRVEKNLLQARNTLTQRTIGPQCTGTIALDVSGMKDGDVAGLCLLQKEYGAVAVRVSGNTKHLVTLKASQRSRVGGNRIDTSRSRVPDSAQENREIVTLPEDQKIIHLRAVCDFGNRADKAYFYYSLDEETWMPIGDELVMRYTLPHFMGYRFGLFNYATKEAGGHADFDYFRIHDTMLNSRRF
jgi:beta-xylosidase